MDINDILKMLDWNNPPETQKLGLEYARQVECLDVFLQPVDKQFSKNIWDNCALILSEKDDALLIPHLYPLLDWLQDLNWPGAVIILERLKKYKDYEKLDIAIQNRIELAKASDDEVWLENLAALRR